MDTTAPLHPARSLPRALPPEVRQAGVVAADLSPDGTTLAIATERGNQLAFVSLATPGRAELLAMVPILPDVRESVLVDAAFSPAPGLVWVLSGDTARSRAAGPQPTALRAVRFQQGGPAALPVSTFAADVVRTVEIPAAVAPGRIAIGRTRPLESGAAIRLPPERATVLLSSLVRPPGEVGGAAAATATAAEPAEAALFRVGASDIATVAITATGRIGWADLTPDGISVIAPVTAPDGALSIAAGPAEALPAEKAPVAAAIAVAPAPGGQIDPRAFPQTQLRIQP